MAQGLDLVGKGLGPYVDKQMRGRHGAQWLAQVEKDDTARLGEPVTHSLEDTGLLLRIITEEPFFAEVLPQPGVRVARILLRVQARLEDVGFTDAEEDQALRTMAQMLRLVGARKLAGEVHELIAPPPPPPPRRRNNAALVRRAVLGKNPGQRREQRGKTSAGQMRLTTLVVGALVVLVALQFLADDASPDDPYEGKWTDRKVGDRLVHKDGVALPDGSHIVLLEGEPQEGSFKGDVYFTAGALYATDRRLAVLDKDDDAGYEPCQGIKDWLTVAEAEDLERGRRLCVVTDRGAVALLTVTSRAKPKQKVTFDLEVWKGPRPTR
ncbi:Swt1 family HEPN domain-containing protein [Actinocorallia sp. A-T 12471]|uniref:Swt1 family HEPN domain-containing protein n=1 Tax=Actinocorallia sp. A-T 12471 TaxID=3089813 RepID=UPI0029CCEB7D|nr:Swt1 family HEPN domain-containing protein [Actinocorallia sp. A-T 12471]MDX6739265.1 Swt1 family HEPN domain-containing protein [Actinocorallia sp. A-T 12471]